MCKIKLRDAHRITLVQFFFDHARVVFNARPVIAGTLFHGSTLNNTNA